jgi:hypothetical protein
MKKQFATLLIGIFWIHTSLFSYDLEVNASYDSYRGLPDGGRNGNTGAFVMANFDTCVYDRIGVQAGGSFGLYNWDGQSNLVFKNSKAVQQQGFVTAGLFTEFNQFNVGVVYDRLFTNHFGIFDVNPSFDQIRFQGSYMFCNEEVGIWGTADLTTAHKTSLGLPLSFRAISQVNLFWTHYFCECGKASIWVGTPYKNSLLYPHKKPGMFTVGFSLRAPLTDRLFLDGTGSYMKARKQDGVNQSTGYAANIFLGLTYFFGEHEECRGSSYMPVANHSNFLVDTNLN